MSTIDNRVVEMNFDGAKFGAGVSQTMGALDRLKAALHLPGASQGLKDINAAAGQFNSSPMEQGVGRIAGSFTAMQATAFGALANIGAKISNVALNMAKSFTTEPLKAGFDEYELKMTSIQTILANTARHGTTLATVNTEFEKLNQYADQTIYNFGDMTRNVGLFTAAGIKVEDATSMIKGFSNAAATTGTSAEKAAGAAYQLSQSLGDGKITLETWNSLQQAGMGNKNMQDSLVQLADKMGAFKGTGTDATKATKSFTKSLEKGWLAPDVMSTYLKIMSGDMDDAAIASLGFSKAQVKGFRDQANMGLDAAMKVRTFTGLMSTLKEAVGSGWSESFALIFGDFNEATDLFSNMSNSIGGFFNRISKNRNDMLQGWKNDGGRTALIEGLTDAFWALGAPLAQVGMAFREIFPATSGQRLAEMTKSFAAFMQEIQASPETLDRLKRTFAGVFAILHIGWTVIKGVATFLGELFLGVTEGDQGILRFTATVGDFFVALDKAITAGGGVTAFFDKLLALVFKVINPIRDAGQAIGKVFEGLDTGAIGGALGGLITTLLSFGSAGEKAAGGASKFKSIISGFASFFHTIASAVADFVEPLTSGIANALNKINFDDLMQALQTLSLGGIALFIKQLGGMFKGLELFKGAGGGIMDKIREGLDGVTGTLSAMQANLKASMLLKIAGAIALLAVSVLLLSSVDAAGLARATAALTVMFVQLGGAMMAFQKIGSIASIAKLNLMASALILLGIAILLMAGAVKILASMSWEELAKGLLGLTVLIGGLIALSKGMDRSRGAIIRSALALVIMSGALKLLVGVIRDLGSLDLATLGKGLGSFALLLAGLALFSRIQAASGTSVAQAATILILAIAIKTLADAVKTFASMSWEELERGFAGLAGGLIAVGLSLRFMPDGAKLLFAALGIGKVAGATMLIAQAMKMYADIDWNTIAKGLASLGGTLGILVVAMKFMPKVGLPQAVGLLIVASAIATLSVAVKTLGSMGTGDAVQGVLAVAALLGILVVALNLMNGTLAGAAAIFIVSAALAVLVPVIATLGALPIPVIVTAIVALAAVFAVLGVAAYLLAPVVPVLMGLGIAIALLGAAMLLAGAGVFLFSVGLTALAVAGAAGTAALVSMVAGLAGLIPMVAKQIGLGIVALITAIADSAVALAEAFVKIVAALLDGVIKLIPKLAQVLITLILAGIHVIETLIPRFIDAGITIIMAFLQGIANNIGRVVNTVTDIVVNFLNALGRNLPRIIQAGIDLIVNFVNGLADGIRKNSQRMGEAGGNLASAIVEGMVKGIGAGAGKVVESAKNMAKDALNAAKKFLGIASPSKEFEKIGQFTSEGFAIGLTGNKEKIQNAVKDMMDQLNGAVASSDEKIQKEQERQAAIWADRVENIRQVERAIQDLNEAKARPIGSTAKTKAARDAEIKRETDARNNAVDSAAERLRQLNMKWADYDNQIRDSQRTLAEYQDEYNRLNNARNTMARDLEDENQALQRLADSHDVLTEKIGEASKALDDARKVRDDYNKSLTDQYGKQEDINKDTKLEDYVKNLEKQIVDTQNYTIALTELRKRGLNDEVYKELLASGTDAMPFVQELLSGGTGAIQQMNTLGVALDREAGKLGSSASTALYQAAVDSAEGFLKGLQNQQANIEFEMDRIAGYMVQAIKNKLGIRSPSRVFAELGSFTAQGLAKGLDDASSMVGRSAENVGQSAIDGMKKTISGLGALIESDVDVNPVIAPVLDLTSIRKDAGTIGSLLETPPLDVNAAYSAASNASAGYRDNQLSRAEAVAAEPAAPIQFTQINNSPKALSAAELYRQTNNQLSVAKGALIGGVKQS